MKKLIIILIILFATKSNAEIIHGTVSGTGYSYNIEVYIPDNTTGLLPAVFFFVGNGEVGTDRNKLYTHGPLRFLNSIPNNLIVVACQPAEAWANEVVVQRFLNEVLSNPLYRVDRNKFYLTGLSGGASAIFTYITKAPETTFIKPAAIVPFSITTGTQCGDFYLGTDYLCGTDLRYQFIPAWGLCGRSDSHHDKMKRLFDRFSEAGWISKWTSYTGGHCCWNDYYNPSYRENGLNIYEWILQYPAVVLPVVLKSFYHANNILYWETSSEQNADRFDVEESEDGINWYKVGEVKSKSLTGEGHKYNFQL